MISTWFPQPEYHQHGQLDVVSWDSYCLIIVSLLSDADSLSSLAAMINTKSDLLQVKLSQNLLLLCT